MTVLFQGEDFLALDKAPGEVTTPPSTRPGATLLDRARQAAPRAALHHPLSRLDAEVSGVVLFALSPRAIALARRASPTKRYLALALGEPAAETAVWTWPIGTHPRRPTLRSCEAGARDAQAAETRVGLLARTCGLNLLALEPVTGRTHQLRVHAAKAGLPLLGDTDYHGPPRWTREDGGIHPLPRALLHAWCVSLPGTPTVIESVPHADLTAAWQAITGTRLETALDPHRSRGLVTGTG